MAADSVQFGDGFASPPARLPEVRRALARWPELAPGTVPEDVPTGWRWEERGGLIVLSVGSASSEPFVAMCDAVEDVMFRWSADEAVRDFPAGTQCRYIHYAPVDGACWDRLWARPHERMGDESQTRRILLRFGRVLAAYREHPFGRRAPNAEPSALIAQKASCALVAAPSSEQDVIDVVALLQRDANFLEGWAGGPPARWLADGLRRKRATSRH